jgi:NAD(P)-dependent dehydrogenase (short-subunit alcohol dehydrogenase family)
MKRMKNKIAIVTGAAGGIGSEIARRMSREGATVLAADINFAGAEAVAAELGNNSSAVQFDLYQSASIEAMVQTAIDRYRGLDILVNNAADTTLTTLDKTVLDTELETFDRSIAANLRGVFIATKAALPHLLARGKGAIVNISSASALFGDTWLVSYSTAKAGVIELTRNTAIQYGKQGVRCNSICPGFIAHGRAREIMADTLKSALNAAYIDRNGGPEDIAALAAFLASDDAGFINGTNVVCDGAHSAAATPWRSGEIKAITR